MNNDEMVIIGIGSALALVAALGFGIAKGCNEDEVIRAEHEVYVHQQAQVQACEVATGEDRCKCLDSLALAEQGMPVWREKPRTRAAKTCWSVERGDKGGLGKKAAGAALRWAADKIGR